MYHLAESSSLGNPDLVIVTKQVPNEVICLISTLTFYNLTTQIPNDVRLALPRDAEEPRLDFPAVHTFRFTGKSFTEGTETHRLSSAPIRTYNPEKILANCFEFRSKIGLGVVIRAL